MFRTCKKRDRCKLFGRGGFTLIEMIVVIVTLGILSTAVVVHYQDLAGSTKTNALLSSLGAFREGLSCWRMTNIIKTGSDGYPDVVTISTSGEVLAQAIPRNPYQSEDNAPDSIVTGVEKGVIVGTRGGWAYNPTTGEIWANTNSDVGATCQNPEGKLYENTW